jgi:hypothetical protein
VPVHLICLLQRPALSNSRLCQPCRPRTRNTSSPWSAQALLPAQFMQSQSILSPLQIIPRSSHHSARTSTLKTNSASSTSPTRTLPITVTRDKSCPHIQVTTTTSSVKRALVPLMRTTAVPTQVYLHHLSLRLLKMRARTSLARERHSAR